VNNDSFGNPWTSATRLNSPSDGRNWLATVPTPVSATAHCGETREEANIVLLVVFTREAGECRRWSTSSSEISS
jgi:hypothetical protein